MYRKGLKGWSPCDTYMQGKAAVQQRRTAVTIHLRSKQLLLFAIARRYAFRIPMPRRRWKHMWIKEWKHNIVLFSLIKWHTWLNSLWNYEDTSLDTISTVIQCCSFGPASYTLTQHSADQCINSHANNVNPTHYVYMTLSLCQTIFHPQKQW